MVKVLWIILVLKGRERKGKGGKWREGEGRERYQSKFLLHSDCKVGS